MPCNLVGLCKRRCGQSGRRAEGTLTILTIPATDDNRRCRNERNEWHGTFIQTAGDIKFQLLAFNYNVYYYGGGGDGTFIYYVK